MKITKRQLRRIIREEKRKLTEWSVDDYAEPPLTAAGLISVLQSLPPDATIWVTRDSETAILKPSHVRPATGGLSDADTGEYIEEEELGQHMLIMTWG